MDANLRELCQSFLTGELSSSSFLQRCLQSMSSCAPSAHVDIARPVRCGFPEVIYGEGKPAESLLEIVAAIHGRGQPVLATRLSPDQQQLLAERYHGAAIQRLGRTFRLPAGASSQQELVGKVAVVTAGTSDLPVAVEAEETLAWMNVRTVALHDLGVAGPHRLPSHLETLQDCDAVVVIAGMEGALPSVVGGYLSCPIIAVPTSVGYGASFQGVAALLGMLNSCASNVAVVNIDAGFKGAYLAGLIAHRSSRSDVPAELKS
jgi:NCAIR mutase (PurE)-related protein